jgi:hypothetical protein
MNRITYRDWLFDCDVEATRRAYETISAGGVETCICSGCKNFLVQRESVLPEEIKQLFEKLGVNYQRDAETYHVTRLPSGLHQYGGWFHFIGHIKKEAIGPVKLTRFTIDFLPGNDLAAEAFENYPLIQIEIMAEIPWALVGVQEPD